ncbi:MAG: SGNH/GDSL hydrolase family protein [Selenomonadaceae bacterium]|nr:SGNH/GDSL hydrolase family protein [Selenomonadaceae bacterium]
MLLNNVPPPPPIVNKSFSFLVLGNSITEHGICEYWWGDWGMGASKRENDFVHVMADTLSKKYNVTFDFINLFQWEAMHYDRAESLQLLEKFSNKNYDFVVIQLGENISNVFTLEQDFVELINYVKKTISSKAEFVMLGQFWKNDLIDMIKQNACTLTKSHFINLTDIQNSKYQVGIGCEVFGEDGTKHIVNHPGVALHPNDKAMKVFVERILKALNLKIT